MDFSKIFKRQKSFKGSKSKSETSDKNNRVTRSNTNLANAASRRPKDNRDALTQGNRWSLSLEETHRPLRPGLRERPSRKASTPALFYSSKPTQDNDQNHISGQLKPQLPQPVGAQRASSGLSLDHTELRAAVLAASQRDIPPSYDDHNLFPPTSTPNNATVDAAIHDTVGAEIGSDGSWDSDFDNSDEEPPPLEARQPVPPRPPPEPPKMERPKMTNGDDVVDGTTKFRIRSKKGRKDDKPEPESSASDDSRVFVEFPTSSENRSGPRLKDAPPHLQHYQIQRRRIIETILSTECSYIESLERLDLQYRKALLDMQPCILSPDTVDKIFYKIEDILECHRLFQLALAAAVEDWDNHEKIGDTFVACFSKSMVLQCYSKYINNFTTAMELVRKTMKQRPQFYSFLQKIQKESKDRLSLFGLMLKPVQRFPQFIMLVQDLLKNTPSNHEDSLPLQLALTELETLAENLDRCRAESEEKSDMIDLINSSNMKVSSPLTKGGYPRRLLKKDTLREIVFDEGGTIEKDKETIIVLTNDSLLSCSTPNRRQQMRSGRSTFRDLYKLRWCASLSDLQVEYHKDSSSAIEIGKINEDIDSLKTIGEIVRKLHFQCPAITLDTVTSSIQALALKADECGKNALQSGATSLTVTFLQKDETFKRTLVMQTIQSRNEWREVIANAKISINNIGSWFTSSTLEPYNLWKPPLFLQSMPCEDQKETLQVQCVHAFVTGNRNTSVWLAFSSDAVAATVNIYDMHDQKLKKTRSMQVVSSVQCMECWNPFSNSISVWLGMEGGSLHEYGTEFPHPRICQVTIQTMSTVMLLKAIENKLYVGLLDDTIEVYSRTEGSRGLDNIQSIRVQAGPLICLSSFGDMLWAASGCDIVTIDPNTYDIVSSRKIYSERNMTVSHVVFVESGFWVAFRDECSLHLYHRETMKLLQDLNLNRPIRDFLRDHGWHTLMREPCTVTALWSASHHLMAGTSNGLILVMPLPKLPGSVPKTTGPCRICCHTLSGPVAFLRTSSTESYDKSRKKVTNSDTSDMKGPLSPSTPRQDLPSTSKINQHNGVIRKISEAGSPMAVDRRSRYGSVYGNPDEFNFDELGIKKTSSLGGFTTQGFDFNNSFPLMIACGDGYRCVISQSAGETSSSDKATAILLWKMVL